jgi:hypothetical protein
MSVYGPNLDIASTGQWGFPLIAKFPTFSTHYTPKSDASLCINKIPHLVLEIISTSAQTDCNRMLLQAACLARLGNALRWHLVPTPFIVSAIYIDDQLRARWYLVYQPSPSGTAVGLILQEAVHY